MKIRRSVFLFCIVTIGLVALLIWFGKKTGEPFSSPVAEAESEPAAEQAKTEPSQRESSVANRTNTPKSAAVDRANPPPPPTQTKAEQMKQGLAALNNEEVVFYGKVLDQFDAPVAGAAISGSIQVNNGTRVGTDHLSLTSDESGRFTISGYKGKNLGLGVSKPGYALATAKTSFVYSLLWPESERHNPDPNNPTVIRMWKLQGAESLTRIDQNYKIPFTDGPINFDLVQGKIVSEGGDLKIIVNRPDGIISQQHPQNWSVRFEIIEGGFIEASDKEWGITYFAPEEGYQPSVIFGNDHGSDMTRRTLFVQSRNGRIYSKLGFSFRINNTPDGLMYITFGGVANTNGSRNWEATAPQR